MNSDRGRRRGCIRVCLGARLHRCFLTLLADRRKRPRRVSYAPAAIDRSLEMLREVSTMAPARATGRMDSPDIQEVALTFGGWFISIKFVNDNDARGWYPLVIQWGGDQTTIRCT